MSALGSWLKWDTVLLHRNRLFLISVILGIIYIGIFYLLRPLGHLDTVLIILIFNDPVVTGYLFAGVLFLFDRQQHTLQAISVLPAPFRMYLLSKTLILSILAVVVAMMMAVATVGLKFHLVHLLLATFLSTVIFSLVGFIISAYSQSFNQLLFYSTPFLIIAGVPFLSFFDVGTPFHFLLLPSTGGIEILKASLLGASPMHMTIMYGQLVFWCGAAWMLAQRKVGAMAAGEAG